MKRRPDLLFVVDVCREEAAVHEANLLGIPIVALVDTNCNPHNIDLVIPSNDDAIRAIKLLVAKVADAVLEGKAMRKEDEAGAAPAVEPQAPAVPRPARQPAPEAEGEHELEDNELLGKATLAKMEAAKPAAPATEDLPAAAAVPEGAGQAGPVDPEGGTKPAGEA
jgi:small subunit ribosomal protein S2